MFREVVTAVEKKLAAPMSDVILNPNSDATPRERIHEAIRQHMLAYREEAGIIGVIEMVSRYDRQVQAARLVRLENVRNQFCESIKQLQAHGLADPDLDPEIATAVLGSMTDRFPEMWLVEKRLDPDFDHGVDQLVRMFTNAMGLKDPARRRRIRSH